MCIAFQNTITVEGKERIIKSLECLLVVPPFPGKSDDVGSQIFYWPGLQPTNHGYVIQPVLGYGHTDGFKQQYRLYTVNNAPDSKGDSVYVNSDWNTHRHVDVNPYDVATGFIEYKGKENDLYNYTCGFREFPQTIMNIQTSIMFNSAALAIESYNDKLVPEGFVFVNIKVEYLDEYIISPTPHEKSTNGEWKLNANLRLFHNMLVFYKDTTDI